MTLGEDQVDAVQTIVLLQRRPQRKASISLQTCWPGQGGRKGSKWKGPESKWRKVHQSRLSPSNKILVEAPGKCLSQGPWRYLSQECEIVWTWLAGGKGWGSKCNSFQKTAVHWPYTSLVRECSCLHLLPGQPGKALQLSMVRPKRSHKRFWLGAGLLNSYCIFLLPFNSFYETLLGGQKSHTRPTHRQPSLIITRIDNL